MYMRGTIQYGITFTFLCILNFDDTKFVFSLFLKKLKSIFIPCHSSFSDNLVIPAQQ